MQKKLAYKILITIGLLLVYRTGLLIIIPGLSADFFKALSPSNVTLPAILSKLTLFSPGIAPYLGMTALLLVMTIFSKKLRKYFFSTNGPAHKFEKIIILLTIIFLSFQTYRLNLFIQLTGEKNLPGFADYYTFLNQILLVSSIVCGGIIIIYIAKMISRQNIINGVIAILMLGYIVRFNREIAHYISHNAPSIQIDPINKISLHLIIISMTVLSIIFILATIPIKIESSSTKTRNTNASLTLPIRLNTAGYIPVITAVILIRIFSTLKPDYDITFSSFAYYIILIILCTLLTILFSYMSFNTKSILKILNRYNFKIKADIKPDQHAQYLKKIYFFAVGVSIVFLNLTCLLPLLINNIAEYPDHILYDFDTTYLLLFCCVIIDISLRIKSLKKINHDMIKICNFNTQLEANLALKTLELNDIPGLVINNRIIPATGTFAYWEICVPAFPYLLPHRNISSGSVSLYVTPENFEKAKQILEKHNQD